MTKSLLEDGILPGLPNDLIRAQYVAAPGNEFESGKFLSEESSACLAANTFGFFLDKPATIPSFPIEGENFWPPHSVRLEVENRFPWSGGDTPGSMLSLKLNHWSWASRASVTSRSGVNARPNCLKPTGGRYGASRWKDTAVYVMIFVRMLSTSTGSMSLNSSNMPSACERAYTGNRAPTVRNPYSSTSTPNQSPGPMAALYPRSKSLLIGMK